MNHPLGFKRISIAFEGDAAICTFKDKRLTEETNIQLLGEDFVRLINEFGQKAILLDFANVELLSSAALGKLITFNRNVQNSGGKLVLFHVSDTILGFFELTKLNRLFTIAGTHDEAHDILGISKPCCS